MVEACKYHGKGCLSKLATSLPSRALTVVSYMNSFFFSVRLMSRSTILRFVQILLKQQKQQPPPASSLADHLAGSSSVSQASSQRGVKQKSGLRIT